MHDLIINESMIRNLSGFWSQCAWKYHTWKYYNRDHADERVLSLDRVSQKQIVYILLFFTGMSLTLPACMKL